MYFLSNVLSDYNWTRTLPMTRLDQRHYRTAPRPVGSLRRQQDVLIRLDLHTWHLLLLISAQQQSDSPLAIHYGHRLYNKWQCLPLRCKPMSFHALSWPAHSPPMYQQMIIAPVRTCLHSPTSAHTLPCLHEARQCPQRHPPLPPRKRVPGSCHS